MASFRVFTKNGWKGPFPEAALISKYRQGGIPDGTRLQDAATGGELAIEDLVADATVILKKSAFDAPPVPSTKLTAAEARAATQKLPESRPRQPAAQAKAAKPAPETAPEPATAPGATTQTTPKLPARGPLPRLPGRSSTRAAVAVPEKTSRGLNLLFVLGCLVLLGGAGGPFLLFESGGAGGEPLLLFGYDLPVRLTMGTADFAWQPSAPLAWAFNALFLIYLVPLVTLVALLDEFLGKGAGRNRWYLRLLTALVAPGCAAAIAALFFSAQAAGIAGDAAIPQSMREAAGFAGFVTAAFESGRAYFSAGPWALAAGSVLCLMSVLICPRARKKTPAAPEPAPAA